MGDSYQVWQWIWPELAKESRVFLYDRAGLGRSGAGPKPRTSDRIVTELHELLSVVGVEGPYILVGHSFGGLNMRLFAARYPDEVGGLVLVDATPLDYPTLEDSLRSEVEQSRLETAISLGSITLRLERDSVVESAEQVREGPPLPDIPVIVVTSGRTSESARFRKAWLALQEEMVDHLEADRQIVTENASHNIHMDQPELVLQAIREVIELAGD
jgi:pimeloyl-ACP methyl ester carboxylesterase